MKTTILKKSIATLLVAGMSITTLVGCGSSSSSSSSNGSTKSGEEVTFPLENQKEYKVHYHARNMYVFDETWPVYQRMAELTNIKLKNTANVVSTDSEGEIQLQAIEGFPSDLYGGNNTADYFMQYGPDGAFYALNEYWEYLPNFKAYLDANPESEGSITAEDGNIYHIPYIQEGDVARTYFIRYDWLDNLGLDVPTTTDEYEEVLIAFRDQDANGNGNPNDEIPYFNDKWEEMIRLVNLWDARCYSQDDYSQRVVPLADGTVYHAWTAEEFKEAIKHVSDWYTEGIIDKEIFTKGNSSRKEYIPGDIGGSTHEWIASTSAYNTSVAMEGFEFLAMAPPITATGNQWEEHQRLLVKPDGWAISINCEAPEELFAYLDYFWSEEGRILTNYGIEGTDWTYVDGEPTFVDAVLNSETAVNTYLESEVGAQLKNGYWMDYAYEIQWTYDKEGVALYMDNDSFMEGCLQLPAISWTEAEKTVLDNLLSAFNDYQDEMIQTWIMADDSSIVDQQWDTYVATCESKGLNEIVEVYQSAYTRLLSVGQD